MVKVITSRILPRHMPYFDWNLPFAQAIIVALRPLVRTALQEATQRGYEKAKKEFGWKTHDCSEMFSTEIDKAKSEGRDEMLKEILLEIEKNKLRWKRL